MLSNYLKILFRGFVRNKIFTFINVVGLSVGLTCFLLIALYVVDEFSFERHQSRLSRIYMVTTEATFDGQTQKWTGVPNIVAPTLAREIPEVEKAVRFFPHDFGNLAFVSSETVKSSEKMLAWADPEIFDVLSYTFLKGDPSVALTRPNTVVMSASSAAKYFGTTEVLGKTITVDQKTTLEITGVFADPPHASRFQHPIIASFISHWFGEEKNQSFGNASFETYLLLHPAADPIVVERKIAELIERDVAKEDRWLSLHLKPLEDVYIYLGDIQDFANPLGKRGDIGQIRILIGLGLIVLLIAGVNYMNLSTAQSQKRYKEIGISKTLGATRRQLAGQFYSEAAVFVLMAMVVSVLLAGTVLPLFNTITGKFIMLDFMSSPWFWGCFLSMWVLISLFSGIYPALYLSAFSPKRVLVASAGGGEGAMLRKGLVVVQFSTSIILIIAAIVLYQQLNYMRDKKLGYQPEQVVAILTTAAETQEQVMSLKTAFEQISDVAVVSRTQSFPGASTSGRNIPPLNGQGEGRSLKTMRSDSRSLDALGIQLLAGKSLPENKLPEDTTIQVILNKAATDFLGLAPSEAVGRRVTISGFGPGKVEVVGVADNFHFTSVREEIGPYCLHNARTEGFSYLLVKLRTTTLSATMQTLEETYKRIVPSAFEYTFLDQRMASLYRSEEQLAQIILIFASLAIGVACLGLYALAAYTTERRIREIGIRKTLGASVLQLTGMLSVDFIQLVVVSFVIAAPLGYVLMNDWLHGFAYRIDLNIFIFIGTGVLSISIAWLTVSLESVKAALMNPVDSLRSD
ncbi:MAG: FtsX-like permease family protein [Cytophagales bacterium]|nr:FtsX-like permease family protein [Cytophagales bacterium]